MSICAISVAEARGQKEIARRRRGAPRDRSCGSRCRSARSTAVSPHGRSALSEPTVTSTPPPRARSTLRLMSRNVQRLPVRSSLTVRFPFLRPSSRRSWPSRPLSPMASIQRQQAGEQLARPTRRRQLFRGRDGSRGSRAQRRSGRLRHPVPARSGRDRVAAAAGTAAVAIGCLSAPAKMVTPPSCSMRTAISAPTRLRLSARIWPRSRLKLGDAHLGFRRARHYRAFGVAHHDVADAHRGAAALGMFDLGAADLDVVAVAEILLDGRDKPRGHNVELDGPAREPPPQAGGPECHERGERGNDDAAAADEPLVPGEEHPSKCAWMRPCQGVGHGRRRKA